MGRCLFVCIFALVIGPGIAAAQVVVTSFEDLPLAVDLGDRVAVRDASGREWRGRITHISKAELIVQSDRRAARFDPSDLRQVTVVGDSIRNGTLIGLGVGVGFAVAYRLKHPDIRSPVGPAIVCGSLGAGLGAALDMLAQRRRIVFRSATVNLVPILKRGEGIGGTVSVSW